MSPIPINETLSGATANLDPLFLAVAIAFILFDVITGYAKAIATGTLNSSKMREGFWHKLAVIFAMMLAAMLDVATEVGFDFGISIPVFKGACIYVACMELTSIVENILTINPHLAKSKLINLFDQDKYSSKEDK